MSLETFRSLHAGPDLLVLANCWDAGTARLTARLGARAVATSSAAVAWSHGYRDGDQLPRELLLATTRSIARVVDVPLSVDCEGGYSDDPAPVAETVAAVVDAGAVGVNLEDGSVASELLARKIARVKGRIDVFVNARIDVYLRALVPPAERVAETIRRATQYKDAGADGIFVPGVLDAGEIATLAKEIRLPLNVLARPGLPPGATLRELGVRRLSAGSDLAQMQWARMSALVRDFLANGRSEPLCEVAVPWAEINAQFGA
jgi:2-methylisocitrate lyase-like PEP mutase family enzyme